MVQNPFPLGLKKLSCLEKVVTEQTRSYNQHLQPETMGLTEYQTISALLQVTENNELQKVGEREEF